MSICSNQTTLLPAQIGLTDASPVLCKKTAIIRASLLLPSRPFTPTSQPPPSPKHHCNHHKKSILSRPADNTAKQDKTLSFIDLVKVIIKFSLQHPSLKVLARHSTLRPSTLTAVMQSFITLQFQIDCQLPDILNQPWREKQKDLMADI